MIHVRFGPRIVAGFDIAVVRRQVQWRPATPGGNVHVPAVVDEKLRKLVVSVVGGGQQRGPSEIGSLIHVGARR
jgi:hypothetical protein